VFDSPQGLQRLAGAAPVTQKSGQSRRVVLRRACNKFFRSATHLWADRSRCKCAWAEAYYRQKRKQGKGHATALRCLAMRWLKILWTMWQERATYDAERHMKDQTRHGSWVLALIPQPESQLT
jgi:transposase